MTQDRDIDFINSDSLLKQTAKDIYVLAEKHSADSLFLLSLLRDLEQIHRQVRVRYFQAALPETRNDLYRFVKDIEEQGGWPYIERMRLKDLLKNMNQNDGLTDGSQKNTDSQEQTES